MKYNTRDFGEIEVKENDIINFVHPIFGFENHRNFVLLHDDEIGENIVWLQSLQEPEICFILINPERFNYEPKISNSLENIIGKGKYECWTIAVINDDIKKTTVNLKSPIIINLETRKAVQIILDEDYPIQFLIIN